MSKHGIHHIITYIYHNYGTRLQLVNFDFDMIVDFFIKRQGPGSQQVTRQALKLYRELSNNAKIADGCGGGQTITLAENTKGQITTSIYSRMITLLKERIRHGLSDRISGIAVSRTFERRTKFNLGGRLHL